MSNEHESTDWPSDAFDDVVIDPDLADLCGMFLQSKRSEVQAMMATLDRPDFLELRRMGHNLAGSGGAYGFPRLSTFGVSLAERARAENVDGVREVLSTLLRYLRAWSKRYG